MTAHIVLFIGAGPSLSAGILKLEKSFVDTVFIAPVSRKGQRGTTSLSIQLAIEALWQNLNSAQDHTGYMRLSVWAFTPIDSNLLDELWNSFGLPGWLELLPSNLIFRDPETIQHIRQRLPLLRPLLGFVSDEVCSNRRTSALPLPFKNFQSRHLDAELTGFWYRNLTVAQLAAKISSISLRFKQIHTKYDGSHGDDRGLLFAPAKNTECHGKAHPTGSSKICFINGRFRFGVALYAGFHYDVRENTGNLRCRLRDCEGNTREMRPEKRSYINIYPNNVLLPKA